jgi:hypothetical protein
MNFLHTPVSNIYFSGTSGTTGISTQDGTSGTSGVNGTDGFSGLSQTSGSSGTNAIAGLSQTSGTNGTNAIAGQSSTSATSGTSGSNANAGQSSTSATSGTNGTDGTSTISGTSGESATAGTSGYGSSGTSATAGTSGYGSNGTSGSSGVDGVSYEYNIESITPTDTATITLDKDLYSGTVLTAGDTHTYTLALSNMSFGDSYLLKINYSGTLTINWPAGLRWVNILNSPPILTQVLGKVDSFIFFCTGVDTYDVHYQINDGEWLPATPPVPGDSYTDEFNTTEYLTNKEFLGEPVYRKMFSLTLPNDDVSTIAHSISSPEYFIATGGFVKETVSDITYIIPNSMSTVTSQDRARSIDIWADSTNLYVRTEQTWPTNVCYVYLEYTKN